MTLQWNAYFWEFLEQTHDKHKWFNIFYCPYVTFQHVLDYPDKPWDWSGLSYNPNITFQHILDYPDKAWDWYELSINPNITTQNILNNIDKPWVWDRILNKQFENEKRIFIESFYHQSLKGINLLIFH